MYAKASKCSFVIDKVEYLGHSISAAGVETDPKKVEAVAKWPVPKTLKELRSRKFVKNYASICKPLHELLKHGNFSWNTEAQMAFETLKAALVSARVLAVPDSSTMFIVETDASIDGIGAVLMQFGHPLAFIHMTLGPRWQKLFVYEKELLAI